MLRTTKSLTAKEKIELENDTRSSLFGAFGTLSQAVGGVVLVVGVYFTWRNLVIAEERQVTDRFTKAIDQIGSDRKEIRLGGIYALERISVDSEKDYEVVMEVLSSFVRERSSLEKNKASKKVLPEDIQAVLNVFKRRDTPRRFREETLDLSYTYLKGANLRGTNCEVKTAKRNRCIKSNLNGINFTGSNLDDADLTGSSLLKASFVRTSLDRTTFALTNLADADFTDATVEKAKLIRCMPIQKQYE